MRFSTPFSWQIGAVFGIGTAFGLSAGCLLAFWIYLGHSAQVGSDLTRKTARVKMLETLVQQQTSTALVALDSAGPVPPAGANLQRVDDDAVVAGPVPVGAAAPKAPEPPGRGIAARTAAQSNHGPSAPAAPQKTLFPTRAVVPASAPPVAGTAVSPKRADPVSATELAEAMNTRVEGVASDKAGVSRLERDGVYLKNGSVVRVGERFPSGEKLLQIDPENARVVTNERQMLLFLGK